MNRSPNVSSSWTKKVAVLGIAVTLSTGGIVTPISKAQIAEAAVSQSSSSAIYNRFEQLVKKPSTLALARNYLINHIDEVSSSQATIMTLHLENAQKEQLDAFAEKIYPERIQKIIDEAYRKKGETYEALLSAITDPGARKIVMESRDKGYKIESSEGMYYPVMDYQGFKQFRAYIHKDIESYIDLMAIESNHPMSYDAAIVITWDELLDRALKREAFLQQYPKSNRTAAVKQAFTIAKAMSFYGASNTPAYDGTDGSRSKLDPEVRTAYEKVVANHSGNSAMITTIKKLLDLLDSTDDIRTKEVDEFLEQNVQ